MFLMFDTSNLFNDAVRPFFGGIDALIYSLIGWIMEGIINISTLTTEVDFIRTLYDRIYLILSIFMIFKLTFSFLKYLVNPEAMVDKEQGVGRLIARTITMIALLIVLPIIFFEPVEFEGSGTTGNILTVLQNGVVKTIPRLLLGTDDKIDSTSNAKYGEGMAIMMLSSFYYSADCENAGSNCFDSDGKTEYSINSIRTFKDSLSLKTGDKFDFYYMWPLSTVAGIVMVVILLGLCIDVAIRAFKLIVLEMLAPIPVMSYIDPKSSKDGAFSHWIKTFISTYIDLFLKLSIVYLVLILISRLGSGDLFGGSWDDPNVTGKSKLFLRVLLIIGLMKFAKEAPKFIKDALGIKDNGGSSFMGKAAAALGGAAAGFAGGLMTGGIGGGISGMAGGFMSGGKNAGTGKPSGAWQVGKDAANKRIQRQTGNQNARGGLGGLLDTIDRKRWGAADKDVASLKKHSEEAAATSKAWNDAVDSAEIGNFNTNEARQAMIDNGIAGNGYDGAGNCILTDLEKGAVLNTMRNYSSKAAGFADSATKTFESKKKLNESRGGGGKINTKHSSFPYASHKRTSTKNNTPNMGYDPTTGDPTKEQNRINKHGG